MSDQELQIALAKMLPEGVWFGAAVLDTEWLHYCWLVEQTLTPEQRDDYFYTHLCGNDKDLDHAYVVSASWQERVEALIKVKEAK